MGNVGEGLAAVRVGGILHRLQGRAGWMEVRSIPGSPRKLVASASYDLKRAHL